MAKDIDIRFKLHPQTGDLVIKEGEESIKQSLRTIILLTYGDRPLQNIGVGLGQMLFENFNIFLSSWLEKNITLNVETYEQRVNLQQVIVNENDTSLMVNILYTMKQGGKPSEFNLTLERIV